MSGVDAFVFKLFRQGEWEAFQAGPEWTGSADDLRDGFVHLSTAGQAPGTAHKHLSDAADLVVGVFETGRLGDALKWEAARDDALFPHLYAALPWRALAASCRMANTPDMLTLPALEAIVDQIRVQRSKAPRQSAQDAPPSDIAHPVEADARDAAPERSEAKDKAS